jgi:tryptophan-rich sensory protein
VTKAAWVAAAVCIAAAALEGLFAGRDVNKRLGELRQPPLSPPFGVWVAIGLCYYVICFLVLLRLLESRPSPLRGFALATVALLLIGNAVWNLVFFRRRSLEGAAMVSLAYAALALLVAVLLLQVDPVSARIFVPYLIYLAYGTWWVLALRRLNR